MDSTKNFMEAISFHIFCPSGFPDYAGNDTAFSNAKTSYVENKTTVMHNFYHKGNGWFGDQSVNFVLTSFDYQLIVDYVTTNYSPDYVSAYGTDEYYYGSTAYYGNFDLRLSTREQYNIPGFSGLSETEAIALTWQRVEEALSVLLSLKFQTVVSDENGSILYYWLTFKTYENNFASKTYTGIFQFDGSSFVRMTDIEDLKVSEGELTYDAVNWNR